MKRRKFIRGTASAAAGATLIPFLPSTVKAGERIFGAGDRLRAGVIGVNGMGFNNIRSFLQHDGVECAAICDVDRNVLEQRQNDVAELQEGRKPLLYGDYRKLLDRKEIDFVIIAVPDHWHCLQFLDALDAGKDIYVEKPIANSIHECDLMVRAAANSDRIVQVGQWQRSDPHWQDAVDFVRSGQLGKIRTVKAWAYMGWDGNFPVVPDEPVPEGVDYDFWLGPAPSRPFNKYRFHWNWRWFWDYAGGLMTDWGVHLLDFALYGMDRYVPESVMSSGGKYAYPGDAKDTPDTQFAIYDFDDFGLVWESAVGIGSGPYGRKHGVAFIGEKGTLVVNRQGWEVIPGMDEDKPRMEAVPLRKASPPGGLLRHAKNHLECMRSRETPNAPIETGARIARIAQLGNIAYRTGRKVYWNMDEGRFVNDPEADELIRVSYRPPWKLPSF
jgi:predicted dehydrogenase